ARDDRGKEDEERDQSRERPHHEAEDEDERDRQGPPEHERAEGAGRQCPPGCEALFRVCGSVGTGIAHRAPPLRCGVRACTGIRYPAAEACAAPFLAGTAGSGSAFRPPGAGEETAYTAVPGRSERR